MTVTEKENFHFKNSKL